MVDVPATLAFTTPVAAPMPTFVTSLLVHAPPVLASVNVVEPPSQAKSVPLIAAGAGFIDTVELEEQPEFVDVNVIVAMPPDTPVTTPVAELIVATLAVPLVQVPPPGVALLSAMVAPGQTGVAPVVAKGKV